MSDPMDERFTPKEKYSLTNRLLDDTGYYFWQACKVVFGLAVVGGLVWGSLYLAQSCAATHGGHWWCWL